MHLVFHPIRSDRRMRLKRAGDTLVINTKRFDFADMAAGTTRQLADLGEWFTDDAERKPDGTLVLHLLLPHGAKASKKRLYPAPIRVEKDGRIALPR